MTNIDPNWKETPDLPGEVYDDHAFCAFCHRNIPIWATRESYVANEEDVYCIDCADYLETMWQTAREAEREDRNQD